MFANGWRSLDFFIPPYVAAGTQTHIRELPLFLRDLAKDAQPTELPDRGEIIKRLVSPSLTVLKNLTNKKQVKNRRNVFFVLEIANHIFSLHLL